MQMVTQHSDIYMQETEKYEFHWKTAIVVYGWVFGESVNEAATSENQLNIQSIEWLHLRSTGNLQFIIGGGGTTVVHPMNKWPSRPPLR